MGGVQVTVLDFLQGLTGRAELCSLEPDFCCLHTMWEPYLATFERARSKIATDDRFSHPWICETGFWPGAANAKAAYLKLFKQHWSPAPHETGVFFSVWIDESAIAAGGLHYNLHALKLRELDDYRLESRKFAAAFRDRFLSRSAVWPNVDVGFGPQTLFQGMAKGSQSRIEEMTVDLAIKFAPFADAVDELLAKCRKPAASLSKRI